jgi:hypothetical protein
MAKTYYLARTTTGAIVCRASAQPYGYTHAAVVSEKPLVAGQVVKTSAVSFSRSADGAMKNISQWYRNNGWLIELVTLEEVDGKTYKAATGKA